jgi:hypothetical protein
MPKPVQPESDAMSRKPVKSATLTALALAFAFIGSSANSTPLRLSSDADFAAFAARMKYYSGASRVRWNISARTRSEADAVVARLGFQLDPADRFLLARASAYSFEETPGLEGAPREPIASMAPLVGQSQSGQACSWQVWVTDPAFPSAGDNPVSVPLAPSDKLPVSGAATFRVGHAGLLQSHLYAFDETKPGAIRDLATVNNVNIPVAAGPENETVLLASSRGAAPYFEGVKKALAASGGERRDLGRQLALRDNLLGTGRGIGANIQPVGPNMVVAKNDVSAKPPAAAEPVADSGAGALIETCQYTLIPQSSVSQ